MREIFLKHDNTWRGREKIQVRGKSTKKGRKEGQRKKENHIYMVLYIYLKENYGRNNTTTKTRNSHDKIDKIIFQNVRIYILTNCVWRGILEYLNILA